MESWHPSGTTVGPMGSSEVENLFFRLMSSRSNGGGGRQEGSAASEGSRACDAAGSPGFHPWLFPITGTAVVPVGMRRTPRGPAWHSLVPAWGEAGGRDVLCQGHALACARAPGRMCLGFPGSLRGDGTRWSHHP